MFRIAYYSISIFLLYFANYTYEYVPQGYKFIAAFAGGIMFVKITRMLKITLRLSR